MVRKVTFLAGKNGKQNVPSPEITASLDIVSVELAKHVRRHQHTSGTFLVAIDGPGASGKSTLAGMLSARLVPRRTTGSGAVGWGVDAGRGFVHEP